MRNEFRRYETINLTQGCLSVSPFLSPREFSLSRSTGIVIETILKGKRRKKTNGGAATEDDIGDHVKLLDCCARSGNLLDHSPRYFNRQTNLDDTALRKKSVEFSVLFSLL